MKYYKVYEYYNIYSIERIMFYYTIIVSILIGVPLFFIILYIIIITIYK
jgi:hypothetical protein